jgi:CMP-2-keto-3-deoxyoctulosonic acid synthetase
MGDQKQAADTGRKTLPIHHEETILYFTRLESVKKRGYLVVVTEHNVCYGLDRRELITSPHLFRPNGLVINLHTTVPFSEKASRSLVHQVSEKFRDGINPHRYDTWHPPNQHV